MESVVEGQGRKEQNAEASSGTASFPGLPGVSKTEQQQGSLLLQTSALHSLGTESAMQTYPVKSVSLCRALLLLF